LELLQQEWPFELRLAGCRVVGRIDQIHRTPDRGMELVEYKTGRPWTQRDADRHLQITLYAKACEQALGVQPSSLILYNLSTNEMVRTQREPAAFRELEGTIRDAAEGILAGRFPAAPGFHCRFCSYRPLCPAHEQTVSLE
jgi:RecB family exonuclease